MFNNMVPTFSTQGHDFHLRFPNDKRVQKPLQDIYSLVIDTYLSIISHFKQFDRSGLCGRLALEQDCAC